MADKVALYLSKQKSKAKGDIADKWNSLEQNYSKKLWHPLTNDVRGLMRDEKFVKGLNLKEFYDSFVSDFEHRINPLRLVEICLPIAKYIFTTTNPEAAYEFLSRIENTVSKDKVAVARIHTAQIELRLQRRDPSGCVIDIAKIRGMIENAQSEVDALVGVTEVHGPFYKVSSSHLKEIGDYAGYYREALRYLGVEDASKMTLEDKYEQALLVSVAALLGKNVYNFGELLAHPVLRSLQGSDVAWLYDLLFAFNCGDLKKLYSLEKHWQEFPDLKKDKAALVQKMRLMAIMEMALGRPSKDRNIAFNDIATACEVAVNDVELLVMKALSKGLVQGSIDQVNQQVNITWVQPRVLNSQQVISMAERITAWRNDVVLMEDVVRENAREILIRS